MDRHPDLEGLKIALPVAGGKLEVYRLRGPKVFAKPSKPFTRIAYAAAHVVADPLSAKEPWLEAAIDWDATLAYRRHLWSWGFGVAEAMDTAQRGMGLDWQASLLLIKKVLEEAKSFPGAVVASGATAARFSSRGHQHHPGPALPSRAVTGVATGLAPVSDGLQ